MTRQLLTVVVCVICAFGLGSLTRETLEQSRRNATQIERNRQDLVLTKGQTDRNGEMLRANSAKMDQLIARQCSTSPAAAAPAR